MITISKTYDTKIIKRILTEPLLWSVMYGQGHDLKTFKPDMTFNYLLIKDSEKGVIGLFQTRALTHMLLECHAFILPQFWGTGISKDAAKAGFEYVAKHTNFLKCFTDIPDDCKEVQRASEAMGWKRFGTVEDGVIYNNKLQQLHFYEYSLRG